MKKFSFIPLLFVFICFEGNAHSGRTDANGCHAGSETYHCHNIKINKQSEEKNRFLNGTITHVRDGDTFEVDGIPIRLAALDCPEKNTKEGLRAFEIASQYKGETANCELTGSKSYDRLVAYCSIKGKDFGSVMMKKSSCKVWRKYDVWKKY